MNETLTLLWDGRNWGVYDRNTLPSHRGKDGKEALFPEHFYREYDVELEDSRVVFRKLLEVRARLAEEKVIPSKHNMDEIFPSLDDLLN